MARTCSVCGKKVTEGMTDDYGSFYCHEGKCFEEYMNETFGEGQWMILGGDVQDELGGYYIVTACNEKGYEGTGIYYTEWEEDD